MAMSLAEVANHADDLGEMADSAKRASDFLKAFAHESRLMILCILADGERSVTELERMLELRQPTVSQQLARLRADGLVAARREGKAIFYRLASAEARAVIATISNLFGSMRSPAHTTLKAG